VLTLQQQQQATAVSDDVDGSGRRRLIVDLMFEPGRLIDSCSSQADAYKTALHC